MAAFGPPILDTILIAGLLYAVLTDLRSRRISNKLTYPVMLLGLVANTVMGGWAGLGHASLGWAAGLGIMLLPFLLGAMGAGDVKLLAAIGAVKGPQFVLVAALYACVAGGAACAVLRDQGAARGQHVPLPQLRLDVGAQGERPQGGSDPVRAGDCRRRGARAAAVFADLA